MERTLMVLVSGNGTTLDNLCAKIHHKTLSAAITCVIGNHVNIAAADVARKWKLPYWTFDPKIYPPREQWDNVFSDLVKSYHPGLIVLAGFDQLIKIPDEYHERIINVHPSLLPRYGGKGMYGDRVHQAVLDAREQETGCTVHICDGKYDNGKILGQVLVPVEVDDTVESLRRRVQTAERKLLPEVIEEYLDILMAKNIY